MRGGWIGAALSAGVVMAMAGAPSAQQANPVQPSIIKDDDNSTAPVIVTPQQPTKPPGKKTKTAAPKVEADPALDARDQLAPSQVQQQMPGAVAQPTAAPARKPAATPAVDAAAPQAAAAGKQPGREAKVVACSGVFGKNSSHLKLAMIYETRNVDFSQVDAGSGNTAMASVLFAKDPKRRLEVWWNKPESRSDTHLIVINGQSTWTAPGNIRLGLTLAEVEKLNHKPFKLLGFNKDNVAAGSDWNGGAMTTLPGGCKLGISMHADPKATAEAVGALAADKEFSSDDPAMRAVNPRVSEILIGY